MKINSSDDKHCLYSFTIDNTLREWQLIPYCIRNNLFNSDDRDDLCYGDAYLAFDELKLKGVNSHNLYNWNAPIDIINNYQKYLSNTDSSVGIHCRCKYSFDQFSGSTTFDEILLFQFEEKQPIGDNYDSINDVSLLTCYEGIQCHSTICLDWREICNGIFNCENGEDEPEECPLLELNECQNNESGVAL
ncbi:hypothetical protein I4U23_027408 [Adineta vaga]|nr:hypothetical protein I4U23_027408 [Adineta vaga]